LTNILPIGRLVAGTVEAGSIDKRFGQIYGVSITLD